MKRYWHGDPPTKCDTCARPITDRFYDAKTSHGPWANMCPRCQEHGPGLNKVGTGIGQEYTFEKESGRWLKTAG